MLLNVTWKRIAFGVILAAAAAAVSSAADASYIVDASSDSIAAPLNTGLLLNAADQYDFSVENAATTLWSAGSNIPYSRSSTAAGIDPIASGYGQWTQNGFTANYGALVGWTAANGYFLIGTGTDLSGLTGDLYLMYWDSYYPDNSGTQTLDVRVPEPGSLSLLGTGLLMLAGFAATRRRKGSGAV